MIQEKLWTVSFFSVSFSFFFISSSVVIISIGEWSAATAMVKNH